MTKSNVHDDALFLAKLCSACHRAGTGDSPIYVVFFISVSSFDSRWN